ncbi:MAG: preprotein translocase subunit SecG [Planctomycetes bacterium]|nr:preprotein translocase subunit SecG [Planctomycetota bacterium]
MFANALNLAPMFGGFLGDLSMVVLYVVFALSSVFLIVIVLLQEGKGGGFTAAFGGLGTEAFGVKAGGINKLTGVLAAIFVVAALVLGVVTKSGQTVAQDLPAETPMQQPVALPGEVPPPGQPAPPPGQPAPPPAQPAPTPGETPPAQPPAEPAQPAPEAPSEPSPPPGPEQPPAEPPAKEPPETPQEPEPGSGAPPAPSEPPAPGNG